MPKQVQKKYYDIHPILNLDCRYNMIFGERSNGKTYAALKFCMQEYFAHGSQFAYVRRWKEDFRGKRGDQLFAALESNHEIESASNGEYHNIKYYAGRWFPANYDEDLGKLVYSDEPLAFGFSLNDMEHDKSVSYPHIDYVIFDEFMTRSLYLPNEFILFMNVLSTIIRDRDNVKIIMLGNTVNKYCPYFNEMGLRHVVDMQPGAIDIYSYGENPEKALRVAVERTKSPNEQGKKSDVYFAFDNPHLQMITGGAWEIDLYPHLPRKYKSTDILLNYFINFNNELLHCEIIGLEDCTFTYIHRKTTPIQDPDNDIIFTEDYDPRPNYFRNIRKPTTDIEKRIAMYFRKEKVFYQDNEVGEIINNYLKYCDTNR